MPKIACLLMIVIQIWNLQKKPEWLQCAYATENRMINATNILILPLITLMNVCSIWKKNFVADLFIRLAQIAFILIIFKRVQLLFKLH